MTQQVRTSYRRHRRAAWGLAVALAVAVAAVVIPLANAADKTFTVTVAPTPICTSATNGGASTVLTLKNTGSPQTMGSAEVYFPPNTVFADVGGHAADEHDDHDLGRAEGRHPFNNLGLAPGQSKVVTVSFKANANFSTSITAVVKQSNNFNDSERHREPVHLQGGFPTLSVVPVLHRLGPRVSGPQPRQRVHHRHGRVPEQRRPQGVDGHALREERRCSRFHLRAGRAAHDVRRSEQCDRASTSSRRCQVCATTRSASPRPVPTRPRSGHCRPRPATPTAARSPPAGPTTSAANRLSNLSANAPNQDFQVVPVVGPFGQGDTVDGGRVPRRLPVRTRARSPTTSTFRTRGWTRTAGRTSGSRRSMGARRTAPPTPRRSISWRR